MSDFLTNNRLGLENLAGTNTLAYFPAVSVLPLPVLVGSGFLENIRLVQENMPQTYANSLAYFAVVSYNRASFK
jgi:hypothetical protein